MNKAAAGVAEAKKPRLLDQVREVMRVRHYSLRTEECSLLWMRR